MKNIFHSKLSIQLRACLIWNLPFIRHSKLDLESPGGCTNLNEIPAFTGMT